MIAAYYNENEPFAAGWLRKLIAAGLIADGTVDERDIKDVRADDLDSYTQVHFFAGIGGWSYALRLAGWPDDRPVWTGSCPCQPFSGAGQRRSITDERHLWPEFCRLIAECGPAVVFGEQVAGKDGRLWLAGVRDDLEALAYGVGAADLCAAGVGAPHIRQRLYWVADAEHAERRAQHGYLEDERDRHDARRAQTHGQLGACGAVRGLADAAGARRDGPVAGPEGEARDEAWLLLPGERSASRGLADAVRAGRPERRPGAGERPAAGSGGAGGLGDTVDARLQERGTNAGKSSAASGAIPGQASLGTSPSTGFWSDADWLPCTDGKARRIEPGSFPLAHGVPARMGRLRGYGNAIVPQVAAEFIRAFAGLGALR